MPYVCHIYVIIMGTYGTSIKENACPDPVWKPVINANTTNTNTKM